MAEVWRPVYGWEELYAVSSHGRIARVSPDRWRLLKPRLNKRHNRYYVLLCRDGRAHARTMHSLVLEAHDKPRPQGMVCRHLDGDATNNNIDNLRWGTPKENTTDCWRHDRIQYGSRNKSAKLNEFDICLMMQMERRGWGVKRLARRFGVSVHTLQEIRRGRSWRHVYVPRHRPLPLFISGKA